MSGAPSQARLSSELLVLVEEYKALRAEVLTNMTASRNGTALAITGLGGLVVLLAGVIVPHPASTASLPVASLFFAAIVLTQVKYVYENLAIGAYLNATLRDAIIGVLQAMPDTNGRSQDAILMWEREDRRIPLLRGRTAIVVMSATILVPMLAALGAVAIYVALAVMDPQRRVFVAPGVFLCILDVSLLGIAGYWGKMADR